MNPNFKKCEILNINKNNVHIGEEHKLKLKKRTLLLLASIVWLIAGFNNIRIGILSYTGHVTVVNNLLSALVFAVFWSSVFYKLVNRQADTIKNYEPELQFFWHFFDKKSILIMAFMMTFWIGLRASHLAPDVFIAVLYSGLGMALFLAGILFGVRYWNEGREAKSE